MAKANMAEPAETNETGDAPLIDMNDASIKKVIARAKKRGYITYEQLNEALPQGEMSSDQIEDISAATIPQDFARNARIHRAWRLVART